MNLLEKGIEINYKKKMSERASFLFGSIEFGFNFDADYVMGLVRARDVEVAVICLYGSERRFKRV